MDQRGHLEFFLDAQADPSTLRDVVRGLLHTIFFHRYFPSVAPTTREVIGLTLPYVADPDLASLIDASTDDLARQIDAERQQPVPAHARQRSSRGGSPAATGCGGGGDSVTRGQVTVQFLEKKRRRAWLIRGEKDICWESWTIRIVVAEAWTETERTKARRVASAKLMNNVMKIITDVNTYRDHIPLITESESNGFPYEITIHRHSDTSWAARMGIY